MPVPPRTPVLVGRSQIVGPAPDPEAPTDAGQLLEAAAAEALRDAGVAGGSIDTVGVCTGLFRHPNIAQRVARSIGAPDAHTILTTWGGHTPIAFIGELGDRVARGEIDIAMMLGGEANATRDTIRSAGGSAPHPHADDDHTDPESWGAPLTMAAEADRARGAELPTNSYAIFDSALRAAAGETLDEARDRAAELWAGYAAVAAANPDLEPHTPMTAAEIRTPSPTNRMVAWPYTKAMCANNRVDHASAVVVTCHEVADRLGIPAEQRVYIHDLVTTSDTDGFLTRADLADVPALRMAATDLRDRWGSIGDFEHLDLYGCFPSVVSFTARELGVDPSRQLTVSGGLGFMGAPLNYAAGQSLSAMVRTLRDDPGSRGLVQGNGGHTAKHAFGVFSTEPPSTEIRTRRLPDAGPDRPRTDDHRRGSAVIDGLTVEVQRSGESRAVAVCRFDDGGRTYANADADDVIAAATGQELVGATVQVDDGVFRL